MSPSNRLPFNMRETQKSRLIEKNTYRIESNKDGCIPLVEDGERRQHVISVAVRVLSVQFEVAQLPITLGGGAAERSAWTLYVAWVQYLTLK